MSEKRPPYYAAVDLGSNSFHLLVAKADNGHLEVIDRHKEMVQIARGLDAQGVLAHETQQEALAALKRINERLRDIPTAQIRAVGTKTLRAARNADKFIAKAEAALGHPINIISGFEEARLVYQGLACSLEDSKQRRLVVDVGGASTEFVVGCGRQPELLESLNLGCVVLAERYFKFGPVTRERMDAAYVAACAVIEPIARIYRNAGWEMAFGTSGTMRAAAELMDADDKGLISRASLDALIEQTIRDGEVINSNVQKLRRDVLPAGMAIIRAIFDQLGIDELHIEDAALKEGLIFESLGRLQPQDCRHASINRLLTSYKCDVEQGLRVSTSATALLQQLPTQDIDNTAPQQLLQWAAALHEIGLQISHNGYHKHGFYILRHHDISGFSRFEQHLLAALVRMHRSSIKLSLIEELGKNKRAAFIQLLVCLRLAVLLNRSRDDEVVAVALEANDEFSQLSLNFPPLWLAQHPLTELNLRYETEQLTQLGIQLSVS